MQPIYLAIMAAMAALCLWAASRTGKGRDAHPDAEGRGPEQGENKEDDKQCTK